MYHVPDTALGIGDILVNQQLKTPALHVIYILAGEKNNKKIILAKYII